MAKLTLNDLASLTNQTSAIATINANNTAIETALENTLSRDGSTPNTMGSSLDMNSNRILNLPAPQNSSEPLRYGDISLLSVTSGITGPASSTNNGLTKWVGTSANQLASTTITVDSSNNASFPANAAITGTLGVTGAAALSSTLGVTGATTLTGAVTHNSTLHQVGAATLDSTLSAGATTLTTLHTTGAITADAAVTVGTTLGVTGVSTHSGGTDLGAGTTSRSPLKFTSGTNLTAPAAGALEYDGTAFYATAVASSRQVVDAWQFATVQGSAVALSNSSTTAQNIFASANDVISLAATTTYFFEGFFSIGTGATSHTTALGFAASSAPTSIKYWAELWSTTAGTISTTAPSFLDVGVTTAVVLNAASTATTTAIRVRGILRTNAATTITPQITFSAGPTGTCQTNVDSWIRFIPVGTSTVAAVGNWS